MNNFQEKANFIWQVADDILRGAFKQHEFGDVILPFVTLRRLDCVLEERKDAVIEYHNKFKDVLQEDQLEPVLIKATNGLEFYNTSKFDLQRLSQDAGNIELNFNNYINGFSKNVYDIVENFQLDKIKSKLVKNNLLFMLVDKFTEVDLHTDKVSNHEMGYIFEELLRRFSEMSKETAGEHYTPREVIRLMVNLLFTEHKNELKGKGIIRTVFDPACGTGGMLTIAKEHIQEHINPNIEVVMYGQELNDKTYAIAKSDVLITGEDADNIKLGTSFSKDGFKRKKFNYMLSNPPYGVSWKKEQEFIKNESNDPYGRFFAGLPRVSDGALLFLQHMISKMEPNGSRIAIVFNSSPLFTGDAGSGESNIRKWIIKNDWLEAIVALPTEIFYNTGIPTFIWILTNKKSKKRKGKVQLIDASKHYERLRKSLGEKRKIITNNQIKELTNIYTKFVENRFSKIFQNEQFKYTKFTIEHPKIEGGKIVYDENGLPIPDRELKEIERIPFHEDIESYFRREIKTYSPNSWIDYSKNNTGYKIMFNSLMYKYSSEKLYQDISREIKELENQVKVLSKDIDYDILRHSEYNQVDVDWISEIPAHWKVLPNRALFEERIERGGESEELLSVTQDRGVIRQIDLEIKIDMSNVDKTKYKRVYKGDLVYNKMRMWQGAVGYSEYNGIVSPAYIVLKPKEGVFSKFFYYLFKSQRYIEQSGRYSYGLCDDMNSLRYEYFKRMLTVVPPIEEQVLITKMIETRLKKLNELVNKKNQIINSFLEIVTGKFYVHENKNIK